MYCTKCGSNIENGAKFCARCGTAVGVAPAMVNPAVNNPPRMNVPQPAMMNNPPNMNAPQLTVPEKKSKMVPIIIAAVALLLVVVGVVLFFVFSDGSDKNDGTKAERENETTVAQTEDALADEYNDTTVGEIEMTTEPVTMAPLPTTDYEYIKEKGTLVIGYTEFAPMNYFDENGNFIGFETEFAKAVCDELGLEAEFRLIKWSDKEKLLNDKDIDCIWNGMVISDERLVNMSVSTPYMLEGQILIVRAEDADKYITAGSLNGASVVAEQGSAGEAVIASDAFFAGVSYTPVFDQASALIEVFAGTADACVVDYVCSIGMIGEESDFKNLVMVGSLIFNEQEYGIGFRKGSDVTAKVNEVINRLAENGTLYEIAEKYDLENNLLLGGRSTLETVTEGKLTVATNACFAPFEYYDENGEFAGIDIEIAQYIANELGLELEIVDMDFDSITHSVSQGKADLGIAAITPTEEKLEYVDFTDSYYTYNVSILSMEDVYSIEGKTVGSLHDSSYFYVSYELSDKDVIHVPYKDLSLLKKDFEEGRLDYIVVESSNEDIFLSENENVQAFWVQDYENYAICYSKENDQLQEKVDAVLSQMISDGKLNEIFEKYF